MDIRTYRREPRKVGHLTFWDTLVSSGVLQQKDGSFLACLRFRGPDMSSAEEAALIAQATRLNALFRRLGSGWGLMTEARRGNVRDYPACAFPDPVSTLIDQERRMFFTTPGRLYETVMTLTLVYRRGTINPGAWKSLFFTNMPLEDTEGETLAWFEDEVQRLAGLFGGCCASVERLTDGALLRYLKSTISLRDQQVAVPAMPVYLDTYLSDSDLELLRQWPSLLRWPRLGGAWLRCVGVKGYPKDTMPGILDALSTLQVDYRCVCRYIPLSHEKAVRELRNYRKAHYGMRKSLGAAAMEQSTGEETELLDIAALEWEEEAGTVQAAVRNGVFSYGYLTQTVVVWDEDFAQATAKAEAVAHAINEADFIAKVETINTMDAWVGTLPGNMYANVRRPLLHSHNLAHLIPATAPWGGLPWNTHLNGPALIRTVGEGHTPFDLDTYDGDVGMAYIAGPIGAGKSTLLATMVAQWLKYPGAQVRIFDTGQSLRCMTYAVGGRWYDVAAELEGQAHHGQHLDDAGAQFWGSPWLPPDEPWQCFELEGVLRTPALIETVIAPLMQTLKERLTGAPTLFVFDEGHLYLLHQAFARGIDDYIRGLRKKNAAVIFSTQSIADAARSDLAPIIGESSMTRILLANYHALEPETAKIYQGWGLRQRQCEIIAALTPKQDYYYQGRRGHRIFQLALGPAGLAFAGASQKPDLALMEDIYQGNGVQFAGEWLHARGLHKEADYLKSEGGL
ncbi:MAG TPA: hypothetical protein VI542_04365 [Candidatus Tectomicrobia bacterium]